MRFISFFSTILGVLLTVGCGKKEVDPTAPPPAAANNPPLAITVAQQYFARFIAREEGEGATRKTFALVPTVDTDRKIGQFLSAAGTRPAQTYYYEIVNGQRRSTIPETVPAAERAAAVEIYFMVTLKLNADSSFELRYIEGRQIDGSSSTISAQNLAGRSFVDSRGRLILSTVAMCEIAKVNRNREDGLKLTFLGPMGAAKMLYKSVLVGLRNTNTPDRGLDFLAPEQRPNPGFVDQFFDFFN